MAEYPTNRAKQKLNRGGVVTLALGENSADMCDFLGQAGFDSIFVDCEHGGFDWSELSDISRACELWGMAAIARVRANDPTLVTRTLDRGVHGIVVPHVTTREEAQQAATAAKYAPEGKRGAAGNRRAYGVPNYHQRANEEIMVVVLIEDIEAVHNLDEILQVDGIDAFSVAPADLGQSMGHTDPTTPEVQRTIDEAIQKIAGSGRTPGTLVNDENVDHYLDMGAKLLNVSWLPWVLNGARGFNQKVAGNTAKG